MEILIKTSAELIEEGIVSIEDIAASAERAECFSETVALIFPTTGTAMLFLESSLCLKLSVWRKLISPPSKSVLPKTPENTVLGGERWLIFKTGDFKRLIESAMAGTEVADE